MIKKTIFFIILYKNIKIIKKNTYLNIRNISYNRILKNIYYNGIKFKIKNSKKILIHEE